EMAQTPVVYGEWVVKGFLWDFVVNNRKGGRMFLVPDGCTHGELHEMALKDYGMDKKIEKVALTYSLPDVILQQMTPDTPPMRVTNDKQVRNLIELDKTHFLRLYVSSQSQDSDEDANETLYDGYKAQFSCGERRSLSLKDNIYVGQSFASKAELVSKLKSVAVEYKFTFSAYKTTKTLYVAKCRVQGCGWKLKASVKHGPKTFWVTKYLKRMKNRNG
ncbi:hypothetical protein IGI04_007299, partial [Brassica rapa subsp. trilocularis]